MLLHIKNMVCPRCIEAVRELLLAEKLAYNSISLGEVVLAISIETSKKNSLSTKLKKLGFELLDDSETKLVNSIHAFIVNRIHYPKTDSSIKLSEALSEHTACPYASLSKLHSKFTGMTIEQFYLQQKIERVKELLCYNEMNLKEIAYQMGYSNPAHLSSQFKKITGMTPSAFKKLGHKGRRTLDSV